MSHLAQLEAESIHIIREVAALFDNPCMFYSIGKDSTVMLHLARKAFAPGRVPFPLLHIDTTWEFGEMAKFRDYLADKHQLDIRVHINQEPDRIRFG
jgi:sulfate adenylyltransferase subunit 2